MVDDDDDDDGDALITGIIIMNGCDHRGLFARIYSKLYLASSDSFSSGLAHVESCDSR